MNKKILKEITKPINKEQRPFNQTKKVLFNLSEQLVKKLAVIQEQYNIKEIRLLGIGNSISAGWTAVNNNVNPLINKLDEFILPYAEQYGVNIKTSSFVLVDNNSNKEIYKLLLHNPSKREIRELFEHSFDGWKRNFSKTIFENYVDKEMAMQYYPDEDERFDDNFGNDILTFCLFNGCTGLLIEKILGLKEEPIDSLCTIMTKKGRIRIWKEELKNLELIANLILNKSRSSYLTVGNFPYINTTVGKILNPSIIELNKVIEERLKNCERTDIYNGIHLSLFQDLNGKLKLDNHPTINEQYESLAGYVYHLSKKLDKI